MTRATEQKQVAFGRFEADLRTGELWRGSVRIHLPAQPFKVLHLLIESAGQIVTKEQLQERIWNKNTNVDFERAIAGSINKIRDALGDSADDPKYIETLPKRGYRFIAKVVSTDTGLLLPDTGPASAGVASTGGALELTRPPESPVESPVSRPASAQVAVRHMHYAGFFWSLVAVACVQAAVLSWLLLGGSPVQPEVNQLTYDSPLSAGPPNPNNLPMLVTDGAFLYATARVEGKPTLAAISIGTGNIQRLAVAQEFSSATLLDISKEGGKLLVLRRSDSSVEQPLWVLPTSGGSALRVGNVMAHAATWMPDGKSILYATGNEIWTVRVGDGISTRFLTLPGAVFWPRWSPDGKVLRFTVIDASSHASSIWEMRHNLQIAKPLGSIGRDRGSACCGTWSVDGRDYIFQISRDRGIDLWELSRSLGEERLTRLTYGPDRYFSPLADRLGDRLYFLGTDEFTQMQRFDRSAKRITAAPSFLLNATRVEYSPDGKTVAWTDANGGLLRASASDGSNRLQLTPPEYEVFAAHWSPDGTQLALMARKPGAPWALYSENASGGQIIELLKEDQNVADPSWSADGKKIVYGREPDLMGKDKGQRQLYTLDIASRRTQPLEGSTGLFSPRWSPDGKWIAALSLDQTRLMLYNVLNGVWGVLAASSAADPVWSRDSRSLYVHAFLADEQPLLRIAVPSGQVEVVATLQDLRSKNAENFFFSGLTSTDEPLLLPKSEPATFIVCNYIHQANNGAKC